MMEDPSSFLLRGVAGVMQVLLLKRRQTVGVSTVVVMLGVSGSGVFTMNKEIRFASLVRYLLWMHRGCIELWVCFPVSRSNDNRRELMA